MKNATGKVYDSRYHPDAQNSYQIGK